MNNFKTILTRKIKIILVLILSFLIRINSSAQCTCTDITAGSNPCPPVATLYSDVNAAASATQVKTMITTLPFDVSGTSYVFCTRYTIPAGVTKIGVLNYMGVPNVTDFNRSNWQAFEVSGCGSPITGTPVTSPSGGAAEFIVTPGSTYKFCITIDISSDYPNGIVESSEFYMFNATTSTPPSTSACGSCTNPVCPIYLTTNPSAVPSTTYPPSNYITESAIGPAIVTECHTVTVGLNKTLGFRQSIYQIINGCATRTFSLYATDASGNCTGLKIDPTRAMGTYSSVFNPEWDYLPAGKYVMCITQTLPDEDCDIDYINTGYYLLNLPVPPTPSCKLVDIDLYDDSQLTTPHSGLNFNCSSNKVYLAPKNVVSKYFTTTDDPDFTWPFPMIKTVLTPTSGNLTNLKINYYDPATGNLIETADAININTHFFARQNGYKISLKKTDNTTGTYNFTTYDVITGLVIASGTIIVTSGNESAKSIVMSPTNFKGSFTCATCGSGSLIQGIDPYIDELGIGTFDPKKAGTGTHDITYTWDNGLTGTLNCKGTKTIQVTVTGGPTITGLSSVCEGSPITLTANPAPPSGATISWTSSATTSATVTSAGLVSGLSAGPSTITYTDNDGCIATKSITVNPILTPTITCGSSSQSSIQFTWVGLVGATSYDASYKINAATTATTASSIPNPYPLTGLNANDQVVIEVTPLGLAGTCFAKGTGTCVATTCTSPTINTQPSTTSKCAGNSETLSVAASGSSGYQWQISSDNGALFTDISTETSASLNIADNTVLNNKQYRVIVKESSGSCPTTSTPVTLIVKPKPAITPMTDVFCSGGNFTASPVDVTNGVVPAGTVYTWGAPVVTGGITGGLAGTSQTNIIGALTNTSNSNQTATYTVTPISGAGCTGATFTETITVKAILAPTVTCGTLTTNSVQFNWASIIGATTFDVSYKIGASGSANPVTGLSSPSYTVPGLNVNDVVVIEVTPVGGTGTCFTKGTGNCTAQSCIAPIIATQPSSTPKCAGNIETLSVVATGASGYQWQISIDNGVSFTDISGETNASFKITDNTLLNNKQYRVIVKESNSLCPITSLPVTITVNTSPNLIVTNPAEVCQPATVDITDPKLISGNSTGAIINYCANSTGSILLTSPNSIRNSGTYYIKSTENGCSIIVPIIVKVNPKPKANFVPTPANVTTINSKSVMLNSSLNAVNYSWVFSDGLVSSDVSPEHEFPNKEQSKQVVILIATSNAGCKDTTNKIITVNEEVIYYVPNTFTPDDDDFNQVFKPVFTSGFDPLTYHLSIFNRWGQLVFESHDTEIGWAGLYGKNGVLVQEGTYTWKIDFKLKENDTHKIEVGNVNILK